MLDLITDIADGAAALAAAALGDEAVGAELVAAVDDRHVGRRAVRRPARRRPALPAEALVADGPPHPPALLGSSGVTDLGDVVFKTQLILLSGQFLGYKPDARARPSIDTERHYVYTRGGQQRERWRQDKAVHLIRNGPGKCE